MFSAVMFALQQDEISGHCVCVCARVCVCVCVQGRSQTLDMSSVKVGADDDDYGIDPELEELIAETAKTINEQKTPVPRRVPAKIKSRNDIREEETRKRFPGIRPWPTLEECMQSPLPKYIVFTSTWLSVTAKGVK